MTDKQVFDVEAAKKDICELEREFYDLDAEAAKKDICELKREFYDLDAEAAKEDICELEREFYDLVKHSRRGNDHTPVEKCKMPCMSFVEGWPLLQTAVDRLINQIGGGVDNSGFTAQEYMSYYTTVFELCTGRLGNENSKLLYAQYKDVFENYINSRVLPSLEEKKGELLLRELLIRWSNHKIMTSWLSRIFRYLDRNDIPGQRLPSLEKTSFLSFYELVCGRMEKQVMDAIIAMIDQERAGEQIDRTLVDDTVAVYLEIGDSTGENKAKCFAESMIMGNEESFQGEASNYLRKRKCDSPAASSKKIKLTSSGKLLG